MLFFLIACHDSKQSTVYTDMYSLTQQQYLEEELHT